MQRLNRSTDTVKLLKDLVNLFEELPIEKQFYLLGYAQSEADRKIINECRKDT